MTLNISRHARCRMQQRGISRAILELVLTHGTEVGRDRAASIFALNRAGLQEIQHSNQLNPQAIEKLGRVAAVVATSERLLLTVMIRHRSRTRARGSRPRFGGVWS